MNCEEKLNWILFDNLLPTDDTGGDGAYLVHYGYNPRSEVLSAAISTNGYSYSYDSVGNSIHAVCNLATNLYAANALNQYTEVTGAGAAQSFTYDADGHQKCAKPKAMPPGDRDFIAVSKGRSEERCPATQRQLYLTAWNGRNFGWNSENRLCEAVTAGSDCGFMRDGSGRCFTDWDYAEDTYTDRVFDGWNPVFERVFDASTELLLSDTVYVWGADLSGTLQGAGGVGGLLAVKRDGAWFVPLYDANGHQKSAKPKAMPPGDRDFIAVPKGRSEERCPATQRQLYVTAYVSETGVVVAEYEYDAFGNTLTQSGSLADSFRHRFSTKPWIAALGVYDYGERVYSPELRRWMSRDPIEEEGGKNLYAFCGNDAVNGVDPYGMLVIRPVSKSPRTSSTLDGWFNGLWASVVIFPDEGEKLRGLVFHMKHTYINITDCDGNPIIDNKSENVQKRFPTDGSAGWDMRFSGRAPVYVNVAHLNGFGKCVKGKIVINSYWEHFPSATKLPKQGTFMTDSLSGSKDAESFPHGKITATRYPESSYAAATSSLLITVELSCSKPYYTITASAKGIETDFSEDRMDRDEDMYGSNPYDW